MFKIRFSRIGRKKRPFYRIVALDARKGRESEYKFLLGNFDPITKELNIEYKEYKALCKLGAQPSASVEKVLRLYGKKNKV